MDNDWKKRLGVVYSTNPEFSYNKGEEEKEETISPESQNLLVLLDRKNMKGKTVTIVRGYKGSIDDIEALGKALKKRCGTGGSVKDGEIIIQGDFCEAVIAILKKENYPVKRSGG